MIESWTVFAARPHPPSGTGPRSFVGANQVAKQKEKARPPLTRQEVLQFKSPPCCRPRRGVKAGAGDRYLRKAESLQRWKAVGATAAAMSY